MCIEYDVLDTLESGEVKDVVYNENLLDFVATQPGFKFNLYRCEGGDYYNWVIKYNGESYFMFEDCGSMEPYSVDYDYLIYTYGNCENFNVCNIY